MYPRQHKKYKMIGGQRRLEIDARNHPFSEVRCIVPPAAVINRKCMCVCMCNFRIAILSIPCQIN